MSRKRLTGAAREEALRQLSARGWREVGGRDAITRAFRFKDFKGAFAFMTKVAHYAEQQNHHPEWCNVYNSVDVTLSTHDAGGITRKDIDMASFMTEIGDDKGE